MTIDKKTLRNIFLGIGGCILFYWILHETDRLVSVYDAIMGVISPFLVGGVLAFILNVPMRSIENCLGKIEKPEIRRPVAVILTILMLLLILALVFGLLIPQVTATARSLGEKLPGFFARVQDQITLFLQNNPELLQWVYDNTNFENLNISDLVQKALGIIGDSVSSIFSGAVSAIGSVSSFMVNAVVSIVFERYCLFSKETLARQGRKLLYAFFPEKFCDVTIRVLRLTNSTFSNFLSGQCLEVCILGTMFAISMAIFRMPYIPLVSVLVAVTAFIPIVGAFVGCIFGALFILVDNPMQAVWFVAMFLILQQIENNLIYPRVVGTSIGLPGMWVLLAVSVGGEVMGVAGMFLMIPVVAVLYVLIREITNARLELRNVDAAKLVPQPPELESHLKKRRESRKKKRTEKKGKK